MSRSTPPASAAASSGAGRRAWPPAPSRRPSRNRGSTRGRTREDLADDVRGPAELAEWERIDQLLAADAAAAAAREAELR
ncbi:hypothetical protein [Streptomyces sp. NPDC048309]|uniref:hypothetical protein n=1 Tax=Streptomyces sp. NPDC048309 TaxID=3154618 RepID=UPI003401F025